VNLDFLYTPVSWVLLQWHHLLNTLGMDPNSGLNWALSIIFLVITARLLLFRLFVKQVKYQRHMQKLQPEMQKIRKKYKDDRAAQQRELMKLQQEQGFNPLAGCLPMFLQWPIFLALYHVLRHLANSVSLCEAHTFSDHKLSLYTFAPKETCSAAQAKLFGAPLAGRLTDSATQIHQLGGERGVMITVCLVLVLISASATFTTQLLVRAGNPVKPEGTAATVQRLMLYVIPLGTLGSGLFFPLGVLLYWFASNTWTMLQQLYINKFHPHEDKVAAANVGVVGKTLAPKPGQRPVRAPKGGKGPSLVKETDGAETAPDTAGTTPPHNAPRPGQRPQRAAKRPPAKRPSQAKKRR
jgi:YidC/Oxa1 family membrane protein insertase